MHLVSFFLSFIAVTYGVAQIFPRPKNITKIRSKTHAGVNITYSEPGLCETSPGVRSYSGYVELPPIPEEFILSRSSTFFWFFEARENPETAPLAIWLNGGPGASSMFGALQENGPCFVGDDSNSTYLNQFPWNNKVNMLYIDQPVQTGFSFSDFANGTLDLLTNTLEFIDFSSVIPQQNLTFLVGTFPTRNEASGPNSTVHAARGTWHFLQTWLAEFPGYKTSDNRVSLWTESYGGKLGPVFMDFFYKQNEKIGEGSLVDAIEIRLDTLSIINGCVDALYVDPAFPEMAFNNTYGIQIFNESHYNWAMTYFKQHCAADIERCQQVELKLDPTRNGNNQEVNEACIAAGICAHKMIGPYGDDGVGAWFDIAHQPLDPFPPSNMYGFLGQPWVQSALGVPVNFTGAALNVAQNLRKTGDPARGGLLEDIASLLDSGVKVAMVYGDRDFACNWIGGEKTSLAIPWSSKNEFASAGYQPIYLSKTYVAGQVRQYGNFSFSRVYQAGHQGILLFSHSILSTSQLIISPKVPAYQPEASYEIFMSAMLGQDISTGQLTVGENYATQGPSSTFNIKNEIPLLPPNRCYVLNLRKMCSEEELSWLRDGTAIVRDYVVIGREPLPEFDLRAQKPLMEV
ncbi:alpha/beta-hydrolase [Mollisia scopiformis]|uniref:Alpha/beta-hydrolase n=1 Tax=Mollisia scopiformis TaxID=149040 RepID=A0A194XMD2_MOLSC|nr:alpha/beta-hydrolase [Mollisia scopiformis]KUJ21338.1 alpha/beta-hydrolase [Mollisia scopiformis]